MRTHEARPRRRENGGSEKKLDNKKPSKTKEDEKHDKGKKHADDMAARVLERFVQRQKD